MIVSHCFVVQFLLNSIIIIHMVHCTSGHAVLHSETFPRGEGAKQMFTEIKGGVVPLHVCRHMAECEAC